MWLFTRTLALILVTALIGGTPSLGAVEGGLRHRVTCQDQYVIVPASAAIEVAQKLTLQAEVVQYHIVFGRCIEYNHSFPPAQWTSSGGHLAVIGSGNQAVFSARRVGRYVVKATFDSHSPSAPVLVQIRNERVVFNFGCSGCGKSPAAGLLAGADGSYYGTTVEGGAYGGGTVFRLQPGSSGFTETILHSFGGSDGGYPNGALIADATGALYGTTSSGGSGGYGTVFQLTPNGSTYTLTTLHAFKGGFDGAFPEAALLLLNGSLYGTTLSGGNVSNPNFSGTVFRLTPSGSGYQETILYRFQSHSDGDSPESTLIADAAGALYGTTISGGGLICGQYLYCGTVFKLTPSGSTYTESVIYRFQGGNDGFRPGTTLLAGAGGTLYGTTFYGGGFGANCLPGGWGCGTVFSLSPSSQDYTENVLYSFQGGSDGSNPTAGLTAGANGAFYGTTATGGFAGTVFKLTPSGSTYAESVLHDFGNSTLDGGTPVGDLIPVGGGRLLGTSTFGGTNGAGTAFRIKP